MPQLLSKNTEVHFISETQLSQKDKGEDSEKQISFILQTFLFNK